MLSGMIQIQKDKCCTFDSRAEEQNLDFLKKDNRIEEETLGRGILVRGERGDKRGSWRNNILTQKKIEGL